MAGRLRLLIQGVGTRTDTLSVPKQPGCYAAALMSSPPATLDAFRDHGEPRHGLTESLSAAVLTMQGLDAVDISMTEVTDHLLDEGIAPFADAYRSLLSAIERRCAEARGRRSGVA